MLHSGSSHVRLCYAASELARVEAGRLACGLAAEGAELRFDALDDAGGSGLSFVLILHGSYLRN